MVERGGGAGAVRFLDRVLNRVHELTVHVIARAVAQALGDDLDSGEAGSFTGRMAAHPVRDEINAPVGIDREAVLVDFPDFSDVRQTTDSQELPPFLSLPFNDGPVFVSNLC